MNDKNEPADISFTQAMQGVKPLAIKPKENLARTTKDHGSLLARRQAAIQQVAKIEQGLSSYGVEMIGSHDVVGYKRPGMQDGVYRKLRLGRYEIEARLDLHRRTLEQSEKELVRFFKDCISHDLRTVLVMPGKGDRNELTPAVLKSHLAHWFKDMDEVQAYHTAQPQHGGAGAFYVLLKKSERKKMLAREQFSRGRL